MHIKLNMGSLSSGDETKKINFLSNELLRLRHFRETINIFLSTVPLTPIALSTIGIVNRGTVVISVKAYQSL